MRTISFFLFTYLKKPVIWLTGAVVILVSYFSFFAKDINVYQPCVIYGEDHSPAAEEVMAYLEDYNYKRCDSAAEAEALVKSGEANIGLILHDDFQDSLLSGDTLQIATLLISDRSLGVTLHQMYATFAIYQTYVPFFAANTATDMGFPASAEEILSYVEKISVPRLEFQLNSVDGRILENVENYDLQLGVLAVSIFAIFGFLCTGLIRRTCRSVRIRFKSKKTYFFKCLLPQCAAMGILLLCAILMGLIIASMAFTVPLLRLTLALALYQAALIWLFAGICLLPLSDYLLTCLIAVDAVISLVLCPLYSGTNLLAHYLVPLRTMSAPYLLYIFWGLFL